jgi:hypothetical protein
MGERTQKSKNKRKQELLQFSGECQKKKVWFSNGLHTEENPPRILPAQFYRTEDDNWVPTEIPLFFKGENDPGKTYDINEYNKMQKSCHEYLTKIKNFNEIVKKVDYLGSILHMDLVRIDAFTVKLLERVWFNEIEIDAAMPIVNYEDSVLNKLEAGYKAMNGENKFITDDNAKNKLNPGCFDPRDKFKKEGK